MFDPLSLHQHSFDLQSIEKVTFIFSNSSAMEATALLDLAESEPGLCSGGGALDVISVSRDRRSAEWTCASISSSLLDELRYRERVGKRTGYDPLQSMQIILCFFLLSSQKH